MNPRWLPSAILRTASFLTPAAERANWLDEWHSELWYVPRSDSVRFCLGAYRDAWWLRRSVPARLPIDSPLACLLTLAILAVLGTVAGLSLPIPAHLARFWHLRLRDWPACCCISLLYTGVLLPVTWFILGRATAGFPALPWRSRLRRGAFFAAKVALVQPIMACGILVAVRMASAAVSLAVCGAWILSYRWVLLDQRRRCPVCLHLLANPVRIGTSSHTFLDWYGAESVCPRGHGLLHAPEVPGSYGGEGRWLGLDCSWEDLFAARGHR
jgi:hypothetical protein